MAYPTISTLPTPPSRQDPANFATEADAFLGALPTFQSQVNAAGDFIEAKAGEALANATDAATSAASASLEAAAWVSGASYTAGDVVWSSSDYASYRAKITHSGVTTNPSLDPTRWKNLTGVQVPLDVNAENRIINGDMSVWQRGQSGTANGYAAADRWLNNHVGGTITQSRQPLSPGDNLGTVGLNPTFFLRQNVTGQTLPAQFAQVQQRIEGVRSYAGQTITILGWARRSSGTGNMAVEVSQFFGTGGGASIEALVAPTTVTLGSSWAPFAVTIAVPSITGKTIGTSVNDCLALRFWTSAGSDWNARSNSLGLQTIGVDLWGVHIRQGTWTAADAALYRPRDPGTELALCQRYYEVFPATSAINGLYVNAFIYSVTKRAQPSLVLVSGDLSGGAFTATASGISQSTNSTGASNVVFGIDAEL